MTIVPLNKILRLQIYKNNNNNKNKTTITNKHLCIKVGVALMPWQPADHPPSTRAQDDVRLSVVTETRGEIQRVLQISVLR